MDTEQVYIIEDIHPKDATYLVKERFLGKKITNVDFDDHEWVEGWKGTSSFTPVEWKYGGQGIFYAVKLSLVEPKKPFWQKLFTWSW